jgi:RHS repeat-associated protein
LAHQLTQSADGTSTVKYTYDAAGRRTMLSLKETGFGLEYQHDDAGRLEWIRRRGLPNSLITLSHDAASRRRGLAFPNQTFTEYRPDVRSRLDWLEVRRAGRLHYFGYQYDDDGNRTEKRVLDMPEGYDLDALHRLETVTRNGPIVERFSYDSVGNRKSTLASPNPGDWVYSNRNELTRTGTTQMHYDRNGNLERKEDSTGVWVYTWDAENRLTRVTLNGYDAARFEYDPLGRRMLKVADRQSTRYSYDGEDVVREVFGEDFREGLRGQIELHQHHYIHGPGVDEPLAVVHGDGSMWYFHADGLGSIVGATDEAGAVVLSRTYDAFGSLETGSQEPGYAYTGREWTPEVRLYYYRARWYDPTVGRFISEDPLGFRASPNLFTYVSNNPGTFVDPSGLVISTQTITRSTDYGIPFSDPNSCGAPGCTWINPSIASQSPCTQRADGTWGFDVTLDADINTFYSFPKSNPLTQDLVLSADTPPDTLGQHERRHADDAAVACLDANLNSGIRTESFASQAACERARVSFGVDLIKYVNKHMLNSQTRWDRYQLLLETLRMLKVR